MFHAGGEEFRTQRGSNERLLTVASSVSGTRWILPTRCQDVFASAASILNIPCFSVDVFRVSQLFRNLRNCSSACFLNEVIRWEV